jgi:hypothetical protein|tara:strand:- start:2321 stop:2554 length:234 start_codon:yes stop_codon:yes gene_type:complete
MIDLNLCNQQQINALLKIKETGNTAFIALLEEQIEKAVLRLQQADDMVMIHRLQGRCEAFNDLLTAVKESHKVVNRS